MAAPLTVQQLLGLFPGRPVRLDEKNGKPGEPPPHCVGSLLGLYRLGLDLRQATEADRFPVVGTIAEHLLECNPTFKRWGNRKWAKRQAQRIVTANDEQEFDGIPMALEFLSRALAWGGQNPGDLELKPKGALPLAPQAQADIEDAVAVAEGASPKEPVLV